MQVMPMAKDGVSQQCAISNFYFYFIFLWQHWVMLRWWSITAKVLPPGAQNPAPAPSTTLPASKARHLPPIQVKLYLTSLLYRWKNYISQFQNILTPKLACWWDGSHQEGELFLYKCQMSHFCKFNGFCFHSKKTNTELQHLTEHLIF